MSAEKVKVETVDIFTVWCEWESDDKARSLLCPILLFALIVDSRHITKIPESA